MKLLHKAGRILSRIGRRLSPPPAGYATEAYSQEGEDLILSRIFQGQNSGFYVDVGAHHPKRWSNTYLFYVRGWSGVNIDAMPGSMELFLKDRPRDCNIEAAIGRENSTPQKFWIFNEPALNTFDETLARSREGGPDQHRIIGAKEVRMRTLSQILSQHVPHNTKIDFMSVDVEGLDLEVLESNDWKLHRPKYVLAECYGVSMAGLAHDPVFAFLMGVRYEMVAKTVNTVVFKDADDSL